MEFITIGSWKRAVIKVGSGLIAPGGLKCSTKYTLPIAGFITECINRGKEIILVSSGAVAAGLSTQPQLLKKNHRSIPEKQALAAIGQTLLMQSWSRFFDFPCSQILLTYDDIHNRKRFVNAKNTLKKLLELGTLPIVNENDTVATEELKVGDNDNLAAYVAMLAEADLLIICTDIDGLYDTDPKKNKNAKLIRVVEKIDSSIFELAGGSKSNISTGGMKTKIEAAQKATILGIDTIIINATKSEVFDYLLNGKLIGTIFKKNPNPIAAKKLWMLYALPASGKIFIDSGAAKAIQKKGASLLPSGIIGIEGDFNQGDAVEIYVRDESNLKLIAKGISQYNSSDLKKIQGKKSNQIRNILGYLTTEEIVHRDELVLIEVEQ
ncbi:glutamate 5-kinase [Rosettibacter primus]|uniref:glutamate 5-kinase n=1 Tax=Rosettibacter primus TaxID=3111523 RepID=UPI003EB97771